jgi:hypothetical protein
MRAWRGAQLAALQIGQIGGIGAGGGDIAERQQFAGRIQDQSLPLGVGGAHTSDRVRTASASALVTGSGSPWLIGAIDRQRVAGVGVHAAI